MGRFTDQERGALIALDAIAIFMEPDLFGHGSAYVEALRPVEVHNQANAVLSEARALRAAQEVSHG